MTIYEIKKKAEEFEIPFRLALSMRKRYLLGEIKAIQTEYNDPETDCPVGIHFLLEALKDARTSIALIDKELMREEERENAVTDAMIEKARSTPVETVIEFIRGKARCIAPDHDDRNPSMFHGTKTNRAVCPVCNKSFDAIACYQYVWNVSFYEAVRKLQ